MMFLGHRHRTAKEEDQRPVREGDSWREWCASVLHEGERHREVRRRQEARDRDLRAVDGDVLEGPGKERG